MKSARQSTRGVEDRDMSLLLNVVEIRVECGRKKDQIQKTNSRKIAMGKNKKTERGTWAIPSRVALLSRTYAYMTNNCT